MTERERERLLREKGLAFFATVTASITHELNNAMAIIEQSAGLLEDLILAREGTAPIPNDQVQRIAARIGRQTERGAAIIKRLNGFAHSVDDAERDLELNELIRDVIAFCQRSAERRRVALDIRPSAEPICLRASPFHALQAVFLSVQQALDGAEEGQTVVVSAEAAPTAARVRVEVPCSGSAEPLDLSYLELLMSQMGSEIMATTEDRLSIQLRFPTPR